MNKHFNEQDLQGEGQQEGQQVGQQVGQQKMDLTDMVEQTEAGFWMAVLSILACIFTIGFVVGATVGVIQQ
jgi:hypothetical protein